MKQRNRRHVSLFLVFCMLLSLPAVGLAEPEVTVTPLPTDYGNQLVVNNQLPTLAPTLGDGGQPEPSAALTLTPNAALPTELTLNASGSGSDKLGRVTVQGEFAPEETFAWEISKVKGDACALTVNPVSGTASADITYTLKSAGEVAYKLTCKAGERTGSMDIKLTVKAAAAADGAAAPTEDTGSETGAQLTGISMEKTAFTAIVGQPVQLPNPLPVPANAAFPEGTVFRAVAQGGSETSLSEISFGKEGEYKVSVLAKMGDATLTTEVSVTVSAASAPADTQAKEPEVKGPETEDKGSEDSKSKKTGASGFSFIDSTVIDDESKNNETADENGAAGGDPGAATGDVTGGTPGDGADGETGETGNPDESGDTNPSGNTEEGDVFTLFSSSDNTQQALNAPVVAAAAVQSLSVTASAGTYIQMNNTTTLTATIYPLDAPQTADWTVTGNQSVVTITPDATGKTCVVKGIGVGYTTIRVQAGNREQLVQINVSHVPSSVKIVADNNATKLGVGDTINAVATITPQTAADYQTVTWQSSNPSVISVAQISNTQASLTAHSNGTVSIYATTSSGSTGMLYMQAFEKAGGLEIKEGSHSLMVNAYMYLTAVITPSTVQTQAVKWESSNPSVASVSTMQSTTCTVRGIAAGNTRITATTTDGSNLTASYDITVAPGVGSITITDTNDKPITSGTIDMGSSNTLQLKALISPAGASQEVEWSTYGTNIASVDRTSGLVTGVSPGTTTITVRSTDGSGRSAYIPVTVEKAATGISIACTTGEDKLMYGKSLQLQATISPADASNKYVDWTSSNPSAATVTSGGLTAYVYGQRVFAVTQVNITAKSRSGSGASATYVVTVYPAATSMEILVNGEKKTSALIDLSKGEYSLQLSANVYPADSDQTVTWSSTSSYLSVDSNGRVTASMPTSGYVYARSGGVQASIQVSAAYGVSKITINGSTELAAGKSIVLTADVTPSNASNKTVTWYCEPTTLATIDAYGRLTAKTGVNIEGTVKVWAIAKDGSGTRSDDFSVSVRPTASTMTIHVDGNSEPSTTATIDLSTGKDRMYLTAKIIPTNANQGVKWVSYNQTVATVNETTGEVTAKAYGTTTITATTTDGTMIQRSITITVGRSVQTIKITGSGNELAALKTMTLNAEILPSSATNKNLTWTSSDPNALAVTSQYTYGYQATVTARTVQNPTTVTITATAADGSGTKGTYEITVVPQVGTLQIVDATGAPFADNAAYIDLGKSNRTLQLKVSVTPTGASTGATWATNNYQVATVDSNGLVKGVAAGTAVITATASDGSGRRATLTVKVATQATKIEIVNTERELYATKTLALRAQATPGSASSTFTWTSSNPDAATVSAYGVVTAKKVDYDTQVTITATASDGSGQSGSITLTIKPISAGITVYQGSTPTTSLTLNLDATDKTALLTAKATPAGVGQTFDWISYNTNVATVVDGLVTAKGVGSARIVVKARDGSGLQTWVDVKVERYATEVTITSANGATSIGIYQTLTLNATVKAADGTTPTTTGVTWESDKPGVAKINSYSDSSAVIYGAAEGTATITATSKNNPSATAQFTVTVTPKATSISIDGVNPRSVNLTSTPDYTETLVAKVEPLGSASQTVTWSTSNASVVSVEATTGKIKALKVGTAIITARATDGSNLSATLTVNVTSSASGIQITGQTEALPGTNVQLTAKVLPATASQTVTWTCNDPDRATVGYSTGVVVIRSTPLNGATWATPIVITATGSDGAIATHEIKVSDRMTGVEIKSNTGETGTTYVSIGGSLTLTATPIPNTLAGKTFTWSSSAESIAKVDASGMVTGVAGGRATITAKANDGSNVSGTISVVVSTPIDSVTITQPTSVDLPAGSSLKLNATVLPESATDKTILWSSSDESLASVTSTGIVTAKAVTETKPVTITAKAAAAPGKLATIILYIKPVAGTVTVSVPSNVEPVINLSASDLTGRQLRLEAKTVPYIASETFTWSSSNTNVAVVDQTGLVTGMGVGTTTITAKANSAANATGSLQVTVTKRATQVVISGPEYVIKGFTAQMKATVSPSDVPVKDVEWSISNGAENASISATGVVTGIKAGTATISAMAKDGSGVVGTRTITVSEPTTDLKIVSNSGDFIINLLNGSGTLQLRVEAGGLPLQPHQSVTWSSSSSSIKVAADGVVTAIAPGSATITAKMTDGSNATATATVTAQTKAEGVIIPDTSNIQILAGGSFTRTAVVMPISATDRSVKWEVSYDDKATNPDWVKVGTTTGVFTTSRDITKLITVTATATNPACAPASFTFTVKPLTTGIEIQRDNVSTGSVINVSLSATTILNLSAVVQPTGATGTVAWTTSNPSVASLIPAGVGKTAVALKATGTVYITATALDGSGRTQTVRIDIAK